MCCASRTKRWRAVHQTPRPKRPPAPPPTRRITVLERRPSAAQSYVVIVGHEREQVRAAVSWMPLNASLTYVTQEPQLGTGHAVRVAQPPTPTSA